MITNLANNQLHNLPAETVYKTPQIDIIKKFKPLFFSNKTFKVAYGGRAGGKSYQIARYILIRCMQGSKRVLCTREVQKSIDESVYKILTDTIREFRLPFRILKTHIRSLINDSEFIFQGLSNITARNLQSIEGVDITWVEEAQFVTQRNFMILEPSVVRKEGAEVLFSFNPRLELDYVYKNWVKEPRPDTLIIHINYDENPRLSQTMRDSIDQKKRTNYAEYLHVYQGHFEKQHEQCIISVEDVAKAMERKISNPEGPIEVGVDVAGAGIDSTVIFKRHGMKIVKWWASDKPMEGSDVATRVLDVAGDDFDIIRVDSTALSDIVSILKMKGVPANKVLGISFAEKAHNTRRYPNIVTEMFFKLNEIIEEVDIPDIEEMLKDLTQRRYTFNNNQMRIVESKKEYKKRESRSPDYGDALLLCFIGKPVKRVRYALA